MAEDSTEFSNPRKKIKLDDEPSKAPAQNIAVKETISSDPESPKKHDGQEKSQASSSEAPKTEDLSPNGGESDSDNSVSALSDFSDISGEESWKAKSSGAMSWVYRNMEEGVSPRSILEQIIPDANVIPNVDDFTLWKLVISIMSEPPPREKLPNINTIEDVIGLMQKCKNIMVLTGAGVSVSCGIPDFRSRNGVYARLAVDFPDLPDPQAMFDIHYFKNDQRPFFKFAKEIFPGQFEPSKCHKFIKLIETHGKLLRNYTQNIDTLEQVAGINNVIQCHGSFATATCMTCLNKCSGDDIKAQIMDQIIPMCPKCDPQTPLSVMKPDIVFFGESLPEEFHQQMSSDKDQCDLLIVIGSSLKVRPVALIPNSLPPKVPQILINKEPLRNLNFDVELLGDCDTIISELCRRLGEGWECLVSTSEPLVQISMDQLLTPPATPTETDKAQTSGETSMETDKNQTSQASSTVTDKTETSQASFTNTDKTETSQAASTFTDKTETSQAAPTVNDKTETSQASSTNTDKTETYQASSSNTDKTETSQASSTNTDKAETSQASSTNTDKTETSQASSTNTDKTETSQATSTVTDKTETSQAASTNIDKTETSQASSTNIDKNQTSKTTPTDTDLTLTSSSEADQSGNNGSSGRPAMETSCSPANADVKMAPSHPKSTEQKDMGLKEKGSGDTSSANFVVGSSECDSVEEVSVQEVADRTVSSTQPGDNEHRTVSSTQPGDNEQSVNIPAETSTADEQRKGKDMAVESASSLNKFSGTLTDTAEDSIGKIDTNLSDLNCNSNSVDQGSEVKDVTQTDTDSCKDSKAGPSTEPDLKSMWQPRFTKLSVAQRLGPNQYCLIPPHRYVFNEAEVFTMLESDSDTDDSMGDLDDDDEDDDDDCEKDSSGIAQNLDDQQSSSKTLGAAETGDKDGEDVTESKSKPVESLNEVTSTSEHLSVKSSDDCSDQKPTSMDTGEVGSTEQRESRVDKIIEGDVPSGKG